MSIPTPKYTHLTAESFEHIYEPAEDTFLFIDALECDLSNIKLRQCATCLEIGSGSGVVITALGTALGNKLKYYAVDINPKACEATVKTAEENNVEIETFCGNLVSPLPKHLFGAIDILLFNPPYVVTPSEEVDSGSLECTWAGGEKGREVLDQLLPHIPSLLSDKGMFYLVLEKSNEIEEVLNFFHKSNFTSFCVSERRAGAEHLFIYKFLKEM